MAPVTEGKEELHRHTVHVCHRQDTQQIIARMHFLAQTVHDEFNVSPDGPIGQHDTLREARRTTGIVDESQFLGLVLMVVDVLSAESHRILAAKHKI